MVAVAMKQIGWPQVEDRVRNKAEAALRSGPKMPYKVRIRVLDKTEESVEEQAWWGVGNLVDDQIFDLVSTEEET